jgi:PAS domain S-box-containing protein
LRYLLGLLISASVIVLYLQVPMLNEARYILIYPTVFLTAWFLGIGPGIVTLFATALSYTYFIAPPVGSLVMDQGQLLRLSVYLLSSLFVIWIIRRGSEAEEKLLEGQDLMEMALGNIGDAVIVTNQQQKILFLNPLAEEMLGHCLPDCAEKLVQEIVKVSGETGEVSFSEVLQRRKIFSGSGTCVVRDGAGRPVEYFCSPILSKRGRKPRGMIITFRDLTEKHRAQQELATSEERLRLALEFSRIGIWELNLEGQATYTNRYHDEAFGYGERLKDWGVAEFEAHIHPEDRERVTRHVREAIAQHRSFDLEFRVLWPDQSVHWMRATGRAQLDPSGRPVRIVGTNTNITDQKRAEEMLQEALFYRDEFLSIASHELKTPLTSLRLQSQIFKRSVQRQEADAYRPERVDRIIDQTDLQVGRLVRLVDDMLDISRIRTGKLSISQEWVSLKDLVLEVVDRHRPQFPALELHDLEDGLVWCDRLRIEQVLSNVLNNALRYGNGRPVEVFMGRSAAGLLVSIKDYGMGIDPALKHKIFSRFQRAVPASEVSGLGLGLYIARQIMDAHQGGIRVESELGQGSIFTIELPLRNGP